MKAEKLIKDAFSASNIVKYVAQKASHLNHQLQKQKLAATELCQDNEDIEGVIKGAHK